MVRRWLGFLSVLGLLGCAGLDDDNPSPRCSQAEACPDDLVCYRSYCIAQTEAADGPDAGGGGRVGSPGTSDAATGSSGAQIDAGNESADAGQPEAATPPPVAAPAPSAPSASPPPPAPEPATPPAPAPSPNGARFRWPWRLEQLTDVPPHLLPCLGSCTILGKKECESCVDERERQQAPERRFLCDDDEGDDDDRQARCGARR